MTSKRKTGPTHAARKRRRRRRNEKWDRSFMRAMRRIGERFGPELLDRVFADALFVPFLFRHETTVEAGPTQPSDAETGVYRITVRTNDPDIIEAMSDETL